MSDIQKIIKYCALAFAIFLAVSIISGIITAFYCGIKIFDSIGISEIELLDKKEIISSDEDIIDSLEIELGATNLTIQTGNKFYIKTNNPKIKYTNDNGKIFIVENEKKYSINNKKKAEVIISIPEDTELSNTIIDSGAGETDIDELISKKINLKLGAGVFNINVLKISDKAKINGGTGVVEINSGSINNLNLKLGIGECNIKANITGDSNIENGIGETTLKLLNENASVKVSKGIGEININNKSVSDGTYGSGEDTIKINGGIGEINIFTN